jgi:hypothetical protein
MGCDCAVVVGGMARGKGCVFVEVGDGRNRCWLVEGGWVGCEGDD